MKEPGPSSPTPLRSERLRAVVRQVVTRRAGGEVLPDDQVIRLHPDLMPELETELRRLSRAGATTKTTASAAVTRTTAAPTMTGARERPTSAPTAARTQTSRPVHRAPPVLTVPGFRVLREISRGGQAVVYEAVQESTGRRVAVKVTREGPLASAAERARFDREVQILAALNHPHIVRVVDRGTTADGSFFLAMDYIAGETLDDWMSRHHPPCPGAQDRAAIDSILRLFLNICDAVSAAHLRGVVHRDLKPSNIRIDERGEPHVLDFGLARAAIAGGDSAGGEVITMTGQFLGSLPWASPEQAEGFNSEIDIRTDVYSLGVILYQMLTGQFPYSVTGSMPTVLTNIVSTVPPAPSETIAKSDPGSAPKGQRRVLRRKRGLDPTLDRIVLKALAKNREDRYQSAGDFARDLANYLAGLPTIAGGAATAPWWRTTPVIVGAVAAGLLIVIGTTVLLTRSAPNETSRQTADASPVARTSPPATPTVTPSAMPTQAQTPTSIPAAMPTSPPAQPIESAKPPSVTTPTIASVIPAATPAPTPAPATQPTPVVAISPAPTPPSPSPAAPKDSGKDAVAIAPKPSSPNLSSPTPPTSEQPSHQPPSQQGSNRAKPAPADAPAPEDPPLPPDFVLRAITLTDLTFAKQFGVGQLIAVRSVARNTIPPRPNGGGARPPRPGGKQPPGGGPPGEGAGGQQPDDENRPDVKVGHLRMTVERLGTDHTIGALDASARQGDVYEIASQDVTSKQIYEPGGNATLNRSLLTKDFPPGRYRVRVELQLNQQKEALRTAAAEFDLAPRH